MQLIKDKNKIRWNQTGQLITDPNLDFFNERFNIQFLNKKFDKHLISNASKIPCNIPKNKVVCGKLPWREKKKFFKNNRLHNHTKWGTLSQTSLLLNYKDF